MKKNLAIHGLRGLAALLVVLYHIYGMSYNGGFFKERESEGIYKIINNFGPMGVNLFFMISGFLIIGSLTRHKNIKDFMVNRIIRVYPVFLCLHIIVFVFGPFINYEWLGDVDFKGYITGFISNLFLLPGIFDVPLAQKNAWSLSYEFTFYIISSLYFFSIYKIENKVFKSISISLLTVITFLVIYYHHTAVFFILGAVVYYSYERFNYKYKKYLSLNGVVLLPLIFIFYNKEDVLSIPILMLSVLFFWVTVKDEGLSSKILKSKLFQYLGTISYSLYLIHPFAMFPLKIIFSSEKVKVIIGNEYLSVLLFGSASLILAVIGSHISYKLIEVWLTGKIKRIQKRKKSLTVESKAV